jgi:hypothetical protein
MAKYQLWSRDEYGQGSILFTSDNLEEVEKRAKQEVTAINVQNALTTDDREKNWEAYMVHIESDAKRDKYQRYVYNGSSPRTKNSVYGVKKDGSVESITLQDIPKLVTKIYLGNISTNRNKEVDWFAKDARRNEITSINHADLNDKMKFFIVQI